MMKYVVFQYQGGGSERIYIFSKDEKHSDMVAALNLPPVWRAVRAGFVACWDDGSLHCNGDSFSLGLQSDKTKDDALLKQSLAA